jgi:hypothetical protein
MDRMNSITVPRLDLTPENVWIQVKDGDITGQVLFSRHYSKYRYKDGRKPKLFVGPGEKQVLITADGLCLFVWRRFKSADGQQGVNCAIFRNESQRLSSKLILEAEKIAAKRWPGERFFTYVNSKKVKSNNPGCCFKKAGWKTCGLTKVNKLIILEKV